MTYRDSMARNGEEFDFFNEGQDWIATWHPPTLPPPIGKPHGSAAICLTADKEIVLISTDNKSWDLPGGRSEGNEDWQTTMEREILEEACSKVEEASLLGFSKGVCTKGQEEGLVLIRSLWRAIVSKQDWKPQYEIKYRLLVPSYKALDKILSKESFPAGRQPIYRRWFYEALGKG